jgi:hypothetical protein
LAFPYISLPHAFSSSLWFLLSFLLSPPRSALIPHSLSSTCFSRPQSLLTVFLLLPTHFLMLPRPQLYPIPVLPGPSLRDPSRKCPFLIKPI